MCSPHKQTHLLWGSRCHLKVQLFRGHLTGRRVILCPLLSVFPAFITSCHINATNLDAILFQEVSISKQLFLFRLPGRCPCSERQIFLCVYFYPIKPESSHLGYVAATTDGALSFEHSFKLGPKTLNLWLMPKKPLKSSYAHSRVRVK